MRAALTLAAGLALVACATTPEPTWSAVVEWQDGNSDIVEHGVTLDDCMDALERFDPDPWAAVSWCEAEQ